MHEICFKELCGNGFITKCYCNKNTTDCDQLGFIYFIEISITMLFEQIIKYSCMTSYWYLIKCEVYCTG